MKQFLHRYVVAALVVGVFAAFSVSAETTLWGEASSSVFASAPPAPPTTVLDQDTFNTTVSDLTASTAAVNMTATSSTSIAINQSSVPGATFTTVFNLNANVNTVGAGSGTTATSSGLLNIRVDNPTTYDLSGSATFVSTNGLGNFQIFMRQQPPGPFLWSNANTGSGSVFSEQTTLQFSDTGSSGLLLPSVNYQLEWNWSVNRGFGRAPVQGIGDFSLTLIEDISDLAGDIDGDGFVGIADMDMILSEWGGADPAADLDGSGTVDGDDLDILLDNWGGGIPPATVPEPGTLALLGLGGIALLRRRR